MLLREDGRLLKLSGNAGCLPYLISGFGVFVIAMAVFADKQPMNSARLIAIVVGVAVTVASTLRRWIVFDRDAGTVVATFRFCGYTRITREQKLNRFSHVACGHQWKQSEKSRRSVYYLSLSGDSSFSLTDSARVEEIVRLALNLASELQLPLHDSTCGPVTVIPVDELRLSLPERLARYPKTTLPDQPTWSFCTVDEFSDRLVVTTEPSGFSLRHAFNMLPMILFGIFIFWIVFSGVGKDPDLGEQIGRGIASLVAALCIVGPVVLLIGEATREVRLEATKTALTFDTKTLLRKTSCSIGFHEIQDIVRYDLVRLGYREIEAKGVVGGIAIRLPQSTLRFAESIPGDQQAVLCKQLRHWISKST